MKNNKAMKLAVLLLALVLITSSFVGGTLAKYTSESQGESTATVAKWSFKVGEGDNKVDITGAETVTFNLFNTVKDSNGTDNETDVSAGKIAPGTSGSFELKVENASEVSADYKVDFTVTNTNSVPLEFSTDGINWSTTLASITGQKLTAGTGTATETVYWRWVFERGSDDTQKVTNNEADTALGTAANAPTVKITATISATQVD